MPILTRDAYYTVSNEVAACARIPEQCRRLLDVNKRNLRPSTDITGPSVKSRRSISTAEILLSQRPY